MKNRLTLIIACSFLLVPLAAAQDPGQTRSKASGIDQSLFSPTVSAGDDFYAYANEKWLEDTKIPGDKSNYGIFTVLDDRTREQVRVLVEQAAEQSAAEGTAAQKVGDLYRSVLDVETRNKRGIKPLGFLLRTIEEVETPADLSKLTARLAKVGVYGPAAAYVSVDARKSDQYTVYVTQSGLTLPDRDYYIEDEPRYTELRTKLTAYIAEILGLAGVEDASAAAASVFSVEKRTAENHWSKTENRDPEKTYNKMTAAEVAEQISGFNWSVFSKTAGFGGQDTFVVRQPSFLAAAGKMYAEVDLQVWKNYYKFKLIDAYASGLSESIERTHFDFHSTAITGISEQEPMWKRGVAVTGSVLGEQVGQLYVEAHFTAEAKSRMNELVENLKRAFAQRIKTRDWMGEGTKKQALQKLAKFTTKIGYPDEWKDYSNLSITGDSLVKNMLSSARFEYQRDLDKLGGPIDRNEWHMTPQTINAYYNPTMNEIVFPAAILQPPFFNLDADDAANYGAIGAVIGHELSHGFDDQGSKYDGDGNLRKWWTESDREEFERRSKGLIDQYNQYSPIDGMTVNGELTLGENIGDLGGLSVTYHAYHLSLDDAAPAVIDGLTGDQRFFLGWSQIWRRLYLDKELRRRLVVDPHSPSENRVNGIVRNLDAWYKAFGVEPGQKLYLPAEQRIRIW